MSSATCNCDGDCHNLLLICNHPSPQYTYSDNQAIEEELRRLNIKDLWPDEFDKKVAISSALKVAAKNENCDKSGLAKLSKIATLLPKSGTIKGTMKLKRKRLFKKNCDPCPIER